MLKIKIKQKVTHINKTIIYIIL